MCIKMLDEGTLTFAARNKGIEDILTNNFSTLPSETVIYICNICIRYIHYSCISHRID